MLTYATGDATEGPARVVHAVCAELFEDGGDNVLAASSALRMLWATDASSSQVPLIDAVKAPLSLHSASIKALMLIKASSSFH